ncbi:MAG: DUF1311 domain-containing protein [Proteobacteria bacterium]|nr:MAG: DUF1311 domain-containing protein [Pseudomonadota bacterium]
MNRIFFAVGIIVGVAGCSSVEKKTQTEASLPAKAATLAKASPSFDCAKSTNPVESTVCESAELPKLDRLMDQLYQAQFKKASKEKKKALKDTQRDWIAFRNSCSENPPADSTECVYEAYQNRIVELGGENQWIELYRNHCLAQAGSPSCRELADVQAKRNKYPELIQDLTPSCEPHVMKNMSGACYQRALAFVETKKLPEALRAADQVCAQDPDHYAACGFKLRYLKPTDKNGWMGVYDSSSGELYIDRGEGDLLVFTADTVWANGHTCSWKKIGKPVKDTVQFETDSDEPNCKPIAVRKGDRISIQDPDRGCQVYCGARGSFADEFARRP